MVENKNDTSKKLANQLMLILSNEEADELVSESLEQQTTVCAYGRN